MIRGPARITMARSSTDLPRMQNQSRARAPLERSLNIVSQVFEKAVKPKKPPTPRMMRQYDLIERVKRYNPNTSEAMLNRAYVYAMKAHGEQRRASGDPYFSHPLEVAAILTDLKLDDATIAAALLHDTIEDTTATRAEIDQMFGSDIGALVEGLTKLKKLDLVTEIEQQLTRKLSERGIAAVVSGRRKRAYSIWRKMERKSIGFEQLSDIFGFRVMVKTLPECYQALGIVHTTWPVVPGRFKDYVSTPKQNDYRSIHTTVIGPGKQRVELQIRTDDMHEIAEYGIAAHALYKDYISSPTEMLSRESNAYAWLRRTIELLAEGSNPEEFLEHTKLELFHDQVFCFTPKGKLIALPRKATPIDFAYAVHTDVGNRAVGCKINGKIAPLVSELANGDEVEILTSRAQLAPPAAWELIVVTGKARAAIRRATRAAVRKQYAGLGRRIVERLFVRAKKEYSDEKLQGALPRLARASIDDVMAAVGRGEMKSSDVARAMYPDYKEERAVAIVPPKAESGWFGLRYAKSLIFKVPEGEGDAAIPIRGVSGDLPVSFAPDGGAVPGDRIVGIMTPGEGIVIYPIQSQALNVF